ncbi:glutamate synthase [Photobacterium profundum]|uniref:Iron-binding zinc finger CDGSH type domain-containing protein n=1 Tax=Photobacterium profundum 3TCK TaxID=314280 RepID=Q1Z5B1_9GAMM|nr:CDGSH iron-sulfur domain-containing protein [Photobacterium profundum]EAS43655.1 hypothetical protein P3TCK_17787 [Photobacterium profundum 3TCK]PSV64164.1 glutamate synthase [Photobacterium profundum]
MSNNIIADNQPVLVQLEKGKTYQFCVCGYSHTQPFCDDSHLGTEFEPMYFTAEKTEQRWLCQCKQSGNQPYCDGSHKAYSEDDIGLEAPNKDDSQ